MNTGHTLHGETRAALQRPVELSPEDTFTAEFVFSPDCEVFEGHFPGNPVLPGVMQIEVVRAAVESALGKPLRIARVSRAKFVGMVRPAKSLIVTGTVSSSDGNTVVKAQLTVDGQTVTSMTVELAAQLSETEG